MLLNETFPVNFKHRAFKHLLRQLLKIIELFKFLYNSLLCWMIDVFLNPHDFLCTFESSCISRHVPKGSSSSFPYGNERECWSKEKSWLDFLPSSDFSCDLFYGLVFYVFLSSRRKSSLKTDERHLYDPSIEGLYLWLIYLLSALHLFRRWQKTEV